MSHSLYIHYLTIIYAKIGEFPLRVKSVLSQCQVRTWFNQEKLHNIMN
jgi:hypothetical protein